MKKLGLLLATIALFAGNATTNTKNTPHSMEGKRLSELSGVYFAAGVLPTFIDSDGQKCVILTRESRGEALNQFDDFGGKKDPGDTLPLYSAAREFWEEAILDKTTPLITQEQVQDYINQENNHTEYVIVSAGASAKEAHVGKYGVTYITDFTEYAQEFFNRFYPARQHEKRHDQQDKDEIAIVKWDDLKDALTKKHPQKDMIILKNKNSYIPCFAQVINPKTRKYEPTIIPLRPTFANKLMPFFRNEPFEQGAHPKVRFYSSVQSQIPQKGMILNRKQDANIARAQKNG